MIGGFFGGDEKALATLADRVEFEVEHNESEYGDETIDRLKLVLAMLRASADMIKRVDYLLNGDEDEDTFNALWAERFEIEEDEQTDD